MSRIRLEISKKYLATLVISGSLIGIAGWYIFLNVSDYSPAGKSKEYAPINEIVKLCIPLVTSLITAASLIIATATATNAEKTSKKNTILDLIKFTMEICKNNDLESKSKTMLEKIENAINVNKSNNFKSHVLANNGARAFHKFLNDNDEKVKKEILLELSKLNFNQKNGPYQADKDKVKKWITSNDIKDLRALWININTLSGALAVKRGVLKDKHAFSIEKSLFEKNIERSNFFKSTILYSNTSKENRNIVTSLIKFHSEHDYNKDMINYREIYSAINPILEEEYSEVGHFFRTIHRVLKMINKYYPRNTEEHKYHIGLLRAQIPNNLALLMLYNALYSEKGRGMARELIASNFFGDYDDFHFYKEKNMNREEIKLRSEHLLNSKRALNLNDAIIAQKLFTYNLESKKIYKTNKKKKTFAFIERVFRFTKKKTINNLEEENLSNRLYHYEKNLIANIEKYFYEYPYYPKNLVVYNPKKKSPSKNTGSEKTIKNATNTESEKLSNSSNKDPLEKVFSYAYAIAQAILDVKKNEDKSN